MDTNDPNPKPSENDDLLPNSAVDEFFQKMNRDFRRPKPSEEAVAAALQAIQALAGDAALEQEAESGAESSYAATREPGVECAKCGGTNSGTNRFCGFCGAALTPAPAAKPLVAHDFKSPGEQHVHHHHYHHHYFSGATAPSDGAGNRSGAAGPLSAGESGEKPGTEAVLRKLVQDWVMAFNAKRVPELVDIYSRDAILVRPDMAAIRGQGGVAKYFEAELGAGLADVQLNCTDIGVLGELTCVSGESRMLAPVAPANRQEWTGKFLMVARREGSEWKILADVWALDSNPAVKPATKPRN